MGLDNPASDPEDFTRSALQGKESRNSETGKGAMAASRKEESKRGTKCTNNVGKGLAVGAQSLPSRRSRGKVRPLDGLLVMYVDADGELVTAPPRGSEGGGEGISSGRGMASFVAQLVAGRNSAQNERVTFSVAGASDTWFHARGVSGSHVILRGNAGGLFTTAQRQAAADVASHLSKGRAQKRCAVTAASPKHLKRPKGAARPGAVLVGQEEEVLTGHPDRGGDLLKEHAEGGREWP